MALEFVIDSAAKPVVVRISGRLTLGPHLRRFGDQVTAYVASNRPAAILLDVEAVSEVDSAGLGELMIVYTTAGEYGSRVGLLRPSQRFLNLLQITSLIGLLPNFETAREANEWLAQG